MIKYHGTPCSPMKIFYEAFANKNVLIPYPRPDDLKKALQVCDKIILDNGAFSVWRKGIAVDWSDFYNWVIKIINRVEFFLIPDVINGTEKENDALLDNYQASARSFKDKGVPIWHVNESLERLEYLAEQYGYIAFGSAGQYAQLGTLAWHSKMNEAMRVVCDNEGLPKVKIHMLRCLDPKLFTQYPFFSGDSTNVAVNHHRGGWENIMNRIEAADSPYKYAGGATQLNLWND